MSDAKPENMAERTLVSEGIGQISPAPLNGHLMQYKCKDGNNTEASTENCQNPKDTSSSGLQPHNSLGCQCCSQSPLPHQSALSDNNQTSKTYSAGHEEVKQTNRHNSPRVSERTDKQHGYQTDSPLRSCQKQTDSKLLRCELCNKLFSEDDLRIENGDTHLTKKKKIIVCQVCNKKYTALEDLHVTKNPQTEVTKPVPLSSMRPPTIIPSHTKSALSSSTDPSKDVQQTKDKPRWPVSNTDVNSRQLVQSIKKEPLAEPQDNFASATGMMQPRKHNFHTACSIYLTTNLDPCVKQNQESKAEKKDFLPGENGQTKRAKLEVSPVAKSTAVKHQEKPSAITSSTITTTGSQTQSEMQLSKDVSCRDSVKEETPTESPCKKETDVKAEVNFKDSNTSDFKFKLPTVSSAYSTGKSINKNKAVPTSNTYTFEGSMMWNPMTVMTSTQQQQQDSKTLPQSKTQTEKKDEENTYSCEGSLFIKPVLPNEIAFEGTLYIKTDSPHFTQMYPPVVSQSSATSTIVTPCTQTKTVTIQSVFTSSGQVISSVSSVPVAVKLGVSKAGDTNNKKQRTNTGQATTTTTNCTMSPRITSTIATTTTTARPTPKEDKVTRVEEEVVEDRKSQLTRKRTLNSGSGGGHTDFSVKSILSTPDRRSGTENPGLPQDQ